LARASARSGGSAHILLHAAWGSQSRRWRQLLGRTWRNARHRRRVWLGQNDDQPLAAATGTSAGWQDRQRQDQVRRCRPAAAQRRKDARISWQQDLDDPARPDGLAQPRLYHRGAGRRAAATASAPGGQITLGPGNRGAAAVADSVAARAAGEL